MVVIHLAISIRKFTSFDDGILLEYLSYMYVVILSFKIYLIYCVTTIHTLNL